MPPRKRTFSVAGLDSEGHFLLKICGSFALETPLRQGPQTVAEFGAWPAFFSLQLLSGSGLAARALRTLSNGVLFHSDYSGVDMPREGYEVLLKALCELTMIL